MRVPRRSALISGHREERAVEGAGLRAKQRCSSTESLRAGETASEICRQDLEGPAPTNKYEWEYSEQ